MSIEKPDPATGQRIVAELLTAVMSVHSYNVIHRDLQRVNMVIDSDGHLLLTDFGISSWFTNEKHVKEDTRGMVLFLKGNIFPKPIIDEHQKNLIQSLKNMTNAQMPGMLIIQYSERIERKSEKLVIIHIRYTCIRCSNRFFASKHCVKYVIEFCEI